MVIIVNRLKYKYGLKGNPPTYKKSAIQCKREASIISKTDNSPIFNQFRIMNGLMKSFYWGEIMKVQRYAEFPVRRALPCKLEHFYMNRNYFCAIILISLLATTTTSVRSLFTATSTLAFRNSGWPSCTAAPRGATIHYSHAKGATD